MRRSLYLLLFWTLAAGAAAQAGDVASPPTADVKEGRIPLNEPVWVVRDGEAVPVVPGTEEYYKLRIAGLAHLERGVLVPSGPMYLRVVQRTDDQRILAQVPEPRRQSGPTGEYYGYSPGKEAIVSMAATAGIEPGQVHRLQVARDAVYRYRTEKGTQTAVPGFRVVVSPTLEEYLALFRKEAMAPERDKVVSVTKMTGPTQGAAKTGRPPRGRPPTASSVSRLGKGPAAAGTPDRIKKMSVSELRRALMDTGRVRGYNKQKVERLERVVEKLRSRVPSGAKSDADMLARAEKALARLKGETAALEKKLDALQDAYKAKMEPGEKEGPKPE